MSEKAAQGQAQYPLSQEGKDQRHTVTWQWFVASLHWKDLLGHDELWRASVGYTQY